MPVTFYIPGPLRAFSGGMRQVEIHASAATVRDAVEALCAAHPGIRDRLLDEQGRLREHINIFVGNENIRYTGDPPLPCPDAEISIIPSVSGG